MALRLERFLDSEKGESLEQSNGFVRGLALILSAKTPVTGIAQGLNFLTGEATLVWRYFLNYIIPILFSVTPRMEIYFSCSCSIPFIRCTIILTFKQLILLIQTGWRFCSFPGLSTVKCVTPLKFLKA